MLRIGIARSVRCAESSLVRCRGQWLASGRRTLADGPGNRTVLPGSQSQTVAGVPQPPILDAQKTNLDAAAGASVKVPPPPPSAPSATSVLSSTTPPTPSINTGNLPPTGYGTAAAGPTSAPPPPPKRPRRRFRNFIYTLFLLSALGYAGGVYYSLVSDNFHDFFTEYVPFGEDAVSYFEEREFRKRFPSKDVAPKNWPQTRGENKVNIGRSSGLSPRTVEETHQDLNRGGKHMNAVDGGKPQPGKAQQVPDDASGREKTQAVEAAKKGTPASDAPAGKDAKVESKPATSAPAQAKTAAPAPAPVSAIAGPQVDHINVPQAAEPVVQDLVKMVNNIITAVNASPEASKFTSVVQTMKGDLNTIISEVGTLKETAVADANKRIQDANTEFDTAAKELVQRLEMEMREQEAKWREEYEVERERLSTTYEKRLQAELESVKKVEEEKAHNSLLQQEVDLQKKYMETVQSKVEQERSGRLSKLNELSTSVSELENLTGKWNAIVDSTLQTQHLHLALSALRSRLNSDNETPTPFLNELIALKQLAPNSDLIAAAIATINPSSYQTGIPSAAALIDRFRRVASEVRKAALLPSDAGVASHAASAVLSRLMFSKKSESGGGVPQGGDVEAVLARSEVALEEGDLDAAAREMNGLQGWAGVLSRDWVGECRRVLEVRQAVEVIATEARLQSLLVE
ncbi:hypothetical protein LTR62_003286 [Meristemomyces frigidus]|uniref:MICOS complex subunit MIC60 n=1 Tax=Meristemomyces frigidus TaxID=1508187 RepID=A0AAN7YRV8_9PEZI|nr:hypothetical protein LTR62_003286 [Meristemomyces frigidus]